MYDITVIGNAPVDALANIEDKILQDFQLNKGDYQVLSGEKFLELNEEVEVNKFQCGGSSANTAWTMGCLGRKVNFIGRVGTDPSGRFFKDEMARHNVDMPPADEGAQTMEIYVLVTPDGQRTFASPGVTAPLNASWVAEEGIANSKWLLIEGYQLLLPEEECAVRKAVDVARANGTKIAMTLASFAVIEESCERLAELIEGGVDLIFANEVEMKTLIDAVGRYSAAEKERLLKKVEQTPRVVTAGAKGATYYDGKGNDTHVACAAVDNPVDTTGAGDAFAAGFLHGMLDNLPVEDSIAMGNNLAGHVIMQLGGRLENVHMDMLKRVAAA